MRPRVFPAEDDGCRARPDGADRTSMRPRVFPAEDAVGVVLIREVVVTSMRPRVFPAEDPAPSAWKLCSGRTSMRPRVFPAEDTPAVPSGRRRRTHFNEAAGIPRGRPRWPRHRRSSCRCHFNEAAGIPRGRRPHHPVPSAGAATSMRPRVFPAEDRRLTRCDRAVAVTSMRPRVFPAEDESGAWVLRFRLDLQ